MERDRQTDGLTNTQRDRLTDGHTQRQTDSPIVKCQVLAVLLQEDESGQQDLRHSHDDRGQDDRPAACT